MRFGVLGHLEASGDRGPLSLGGRKQRTVLAMLLLHPNEVVSRDRLFEGLWPDAIPPSAAESLDAYIYRLRKLLGHDRVVRRRGGYLLRVEAGELDADEFHRALASAAQAVEVGDRAAAGDALTTALGLWRGPAWGDMLDLGPANLDAQRLEDQRLGALESSIELQLDLGRGPELVTELEQLVAEHPLRERLVRSLMLALYRAGRQTAALEAFQAARSRLVDELGLELGPELHQLQREILEHDPKLGAPRSVSPMRGSSFSKRAALAGGVAAAIAVGLFGLGASGARRQPSLPAGARGVVGIAVGSGRPAVSAAIALPGTPTGAVSGSGSVWVTDASNGTVSRIDPASGIVVEKLTVGGDPASITSGDGAIWIANTDGATVLRIDPTTETVTQTIPLGGSNPDAIAFAAGRLWVADSTTRAIYELDPMTGEPLRTIPVQVSPSAIAFGAGRLWVSGYDRATVLSLDPTSGKTAGRVHVGTGPSALTFADGELWVANSLDSTVSEVDPLRLVVRATIPVGSGPASITADAGSIWVANQYSGTLSRIDPTRDKVVTTVALGGLPQSLTAGGSRLWVGVAPSGGSHHGGTLLVASAQPFTSVDPAFFNSTAPPQFDGMAYDTLVTFDHTGGVAGLRLVPDLALALPTPTHAGLTYTFRLRPGIRYSNGTLMRAKDFRRAIERLFRADSPGTDFYTDIVGAATCAKRPSSCDLARGIVTDNATRTIVFHLTAPDPEFLYHLTEQDYTAPVPPGTPDHDTVLKPFPGTGPYRIAQANQGGVTFVRNRYFREWSHAAQPDGYPNTIVWRYFHTPQAATSAVRSGQADWLNGLIPLPDYRQIELQAPARLHTHPLFAVEFLAFNTHIPPFNQLLARRALNYGIDRNKIAQLYGGRVFAVPTCQPLAPGLPGYRPYCPYTPNTSTNAVYAGPDLVHAQRLVTLSGTRGERVAVLGSTDEGYIPSQVPAYVASVLRTLGYRTTLHLAPIASITGAMLARFPISTNGDWLTDYPDPSSYIPPFFACDGGGNHGLFFDPALDREMRRAESLELSAPVTADALWTSIDHTITNQAAWVPTVTPGVVDLVSQRLGNYQFNPVWQFLMDQSWVQ